MVTAWQPQWDYPCGEDAKKRVLHSYQIFFHNDQIIIILAGDMCVFIFPRAFLWNEMAQSGTRSSKRETGMIREG